MIPFDTRLCEILEAVMVKEPEQKYLQYLTDAASQLMIQTNKIFQNNINILSDEKLKMYGLRVNKYSSLTIAFTSIKNGDPTIEILEDGIRNGKELYHEVNSEFYPEWSNSNKERRREILEEILLPHMLFIRFLEKHKKNLSLEIVMYSNQALKYKNGDFTGQIDTGERMIIINFFGDSLCSVFIYNLENSKPEIIRGIKQARIVNKTSSLIEAQGFGLSSNGIPIDDLYTKIFFENNEVVAVEYTKTSNNASILHNKKTS